jgi:hypothetical protein
VSRQRICPLATENFHFCGAFAPVFYLFALVHPRVTRIEKHVILMTMQHLMVCATSDSLAAV